MSRSQRALQTETTPASPLAASPAIQLETADADQRFAPERQRLANTTTNLAPGLYIEKVAAPEPAGLGLLLMATALTMRRPKRRTAK